MLEKWDDTEFAKLSPDGAFVEQIGVDIDVRAVRVFCNENNRDPESLTDKEIERFTKKPVKAVSL